jgi:hypothetical protein
VEIEKKIVVGRLARLSRNFHFGLLGRSAAYT